MISTSVIKSLSKEFIIKLTNDFKQKPSIFVLCLIGIIILIQLERINSNIKENEYVNAYVTNTDEIRLNH